MLALPCVAFVLPTVGYEVLRDVWRVERQPERIGKVGLLVPTIV
jgi:hypothetical protein